MLVELWLWEACVISPTQYEPELQYDVEHNVLIMISGNDCSINPSSHPFIQFSFY